MTSHQPEQAAAVADRMLLLRDGTLQAEGSPAQVLTPETLAALYGLERCA